MNPSSFKIAVDKVLLENPVSDQILLIFINLESKALTCYYARQSLYAPCLAYVTIYIFELSSS